jgi:hypothetical protein
MFIVEQSELDTHAGHTCNHYAHYAEDMVSIWTMIMYIARDGSTFLYHLPGNLFLLLSRSLVL